MIVKLIVKDNFEAAHYIAGHKKCGRVHGHSYKVQVEFKGRVVYAQSMLIDFATLSSVVKAATSLLDHKTLNQELAVPATAEHIARWLWVKIVDELERKNIKKVKLNSVTVWETDKYGVKFEGEDK